MPAMLGWMQVPTPANATALSSRPAQPLHVHPVNDFIETYAHAMDIAQCASIIARFEKSPHLHRGVTGAGLNLVRKDSWDLTLSQHAEWSDVDQALNVAVFRGLKMYLRKYPHLLLAPFALQVKDPTSNALVTLNEATLNGLDDPALSSILTKVFRPGETNIQRYTADQGGYPYWHCESYPRAANAETLHRVLLWTLYLNDSFREGETEFLYQRRKIVPSVGTLLLAPTAFTHTHRGNMSVGGDKYIATGWLLFERAEKLYR